jgi:hypothetical protein
MNIRKQFEFLIKEHGLKYQFQSFKKSVNNTFWGPMDAHSFYNEYGCFTIYIMVQWNDIDFYYSPKFSNNQAELLQNKIDLNSQGIEFWKDLQKKLFGGRKLFFNTLVKVIKYQILTNNEFYGLRIFK